MVEVGSTKTKPAPAEYLTIPTPAPNGQDKASAVRPPLAAPKRAFSVDEPKDPSDAIVEAAERLLQAATARIAYHETHLRRLREASASFAVLARQNVAEQPSIAQDDLTALLQIARTLEPSTGEQ